MLHRLRHTLFLVVQLGIVAGGAFAVLIEPQSWIGVLICIGSGFIASYVCERIARLLLRRTLDRLRRAASDLGSPGDSADVIPARGDEFYRLIHAVNAAGARLAAAADSERKLLEELKRRERLAFLGELAASVAHEVNNPLDGVQNCARILRRSLDDPPRVQQMLGLIDDGLSRIELIVRRLLTLARENVIKPSEIRVRDVVDAALHSVAEALARRGVRVTCNTEGDDRVRADGLLLQQVFVNLLSNAADAMTDGGSIRITTQREGPEGELSNVPKCARWIRIDVADSGAGIPPENLPHIFEPFYTTKRQGRGTGLGLAIAARIIEAHQGTIEVQPRGVDDRGAVFTLRLPALSASESGDTAYALSVSEHRTAMEPHRG